jgi:hypothetical protein
MFQSVKGAKLAGSLTLLLAMAAACSSGRSAGPGSPPSGSPPPELTPNLCQPSDPSCTGQLAPGTHSSANLITPFTFDVPNGWSKELDVPGSFGLTSRAFPTGYIAVIPDWQIVSQSHCSLDPERGVGRTVDDLVTWLTEHPGLITSTPAPVALGGLEGQVVEIEKDPDWKDTRGKGSVGPEHPCPGQVGLFTHKGTIDDPGYWDINDSMRMRLLFLDAGSHHVVTVHIETSDRAGFEDFVEAATPIVESFDFSATP